MSTGTGSPEGIEAQGSDQPAHPSSKHTDAGSSAPTTERRRLLRRHRDLAGEDDLERQDREDRLTARLAAQWALMREERRDERSQDARPLTAGSSNFTRAQVPWGLDLAAAWGWRFLVICAAGWLIFWALSFFAVITIPLVISLLIAALSRPLVNRLDQWGLPRGVAALVVVVSGLAFVAALLAFAGQQVAAGADDLVDSTLRGLDQIRDWLKEGPLHASDSQINGYLDQAQEAIAASSQNGSVLSQVTSLGTTVTNVLAGFFIIVFATYFFLAEGQRIWSWLVRLSPRAARPLVDSSGRAAWISLVHFVRATVIVAAVDSIGIMIGAAILGVPFVAAIGVLVFLGAFIPLVGATVAGAVAVLVALVDQGPIDALIMVGIVLAVQQIEGNVLQPFLMGRWVSVHPLGIILAIATGVIVAGVAGALVAVPLAAAVNAVVIHLAGYTEPPADDPEAELAEDYRELGVRDPHEELSDEEQRAEAKASSRDRGSSDD